MTENLPEPGEEGAAFGFGADMRCLPQPEPGAVICHREDAVAVADHLPQQADMGRAVRFFRAERDALQEAGRAERAGDPQAARQAAMKERMQPRAGRRQHAGKSPAQRNLQEALPGAAPIGMVRTAREIRAAIVAEARMRDDAEIDAETERLDDAGRRRSDTVATGLVNGRTLAEP